MANDVRNLLAQLAQSDFSYRQFDEGAASEAPGNWPIFRVVTQHPVMKRRAGAAIKFSSTFAVADRGAERPPQASARADDQQQERRVGGPGAMFRRYAAPPTAKQQPADVRSLLRRLSEER